MLALGQPEGDVLPITHTSELVPGDLLWVEFPFGARGWIKYGGDETFTVLSIDPETGDVTTRDQSGGEATFGGGSRDEMLARLSELTSFSAVVAFRPRPETPIQSRLRMLAEQAGASGYDLVPMATWEGLRPGDYVAMSYDYDRVILVTSFPQEGLVEGDLVYSDNPEDIEGELWVFDAFHPVEPQEAAFRAPGFEEIVGKVPGSAILLLGGAAVLGGVFLLARG